MDQPAAPPPPGYVVHMNDPQTYQMELGITIGVAAIAISTAFLVLRLYTRVACVKSLSFDDLFITLAWVCATVFQGLAIYLRAAKQIGVHVWEVTVGQLNTVLLNITVNAVLFLILMMFAKIALCLFYRRLSDARWFQISIWSTIALTSLYSIAFSFALIFACNPIEKTWNVTVTEGQCANKGALYLGQTAFNMLTDLTTLVLPIPVVVKLNLPSVQKLGVVLMFVVGSLTLITSCIRLALLMPMLRTVDVTRAVSTPTILISIESGLAIVCICFPSLRLFLRRIVPSTVGSWHDSALQKSQNPQTAIEMGSQPKSRPMSDITLFKGRRILDQSWERMPEPDIPLHPAPLPQLPKTGADQDPFDFDVKLPQEVILASRTTKTTPPAIPGASVRANSHDWRMNV